MNAKEIFEELEYLYSKEDYNKYNLENQILSMCNGNGSILKEVLEMINKYRENKMMI